MRVTLASRTTIFFTVAAMVVVPGVGVLFALQFFEGRTETALVARLITPESEKDDDFDLVVERNAARGLFGWGAA